MKKRISAYLTILLAFFCYQTKAQNLAVESFELAPTDLTANTPGTMVYDQNGHVCALIKIETTQKGFRFDVGVLGVTSVVEQTGEVWVYVPFGVRKMTIHHSHLGTLRDYPIPCAIEKGRTYVMRLTSGTVKTVVEYEISRQFLHVQLDPSDAFLEIDGKEKSTEWGVYQELLPFGKYSYRAYRKDYHDLVGTVDISDPENTHRLNLVLRPAFGYVSILESAQPEIKGASVYVDDEKVGVLPVANLQISSGQHRLKIMKSLYETYNAVFEVSDEEKKILTPELLPDFADVTLKTASDALIYVNGEQKGKGIWSGRLASGSYVFESRLSGHITTKMPYDITRRDHSSTITVQDPTPIYGSLVISSTPSTARITINGKYVGDTPKLLGKQVIGDYTVRVDMDGYESQIRTVTVTEGNESSLKFELAKKQNTSTSYSNVTSAPVSKQSVPKSGTANCYIISNAGTYKFKTVKGNSSESVGNVVSAAVLWETFGTDIAPKVGDLIRNVSYSDGYITYSTADVFKEGNALIAAKDAKGNILWSWHIWLTDEPQGQVYYHGAGTVMDRNLGATSASPGDVGALGLLYQWGRKDPFVGSSSIYSDIFAETSINLPKPVVSKAKTGTIAYATSHPTTLIIHNDDNSDWYYTGTSSKDETRWQSEKTVYDPCPAGWRVPDGGSQGVWSKARGTIIPSKIQYDNSKEGVNLSGMFGFDSMIWYPAAGYISTWSSKKLINVGYYGYYWSVTPCTVGAYTLQISNERVLDSYGYIDLSFALPVRCVKE